MLFKQVPQLADRPVLVVGEHIHDDRRAARSVRLVLRFFIGHAGLFPGAAANRPLDVVGGHIVLLRVGDDRPQPRVHVGVAAAGAGGDRQFFDEAREDLAALGVGGPLLVLDGMPLGMAGHVKTPEESTNSGWKMLPQGRDLYRRRARIIHTSACSSQGRPW